MESHGFLAQALIYLAAAVIAVPLSKRLGLGSVLGFLLAGIAPSIAGAFPPDATGIDHVELAWQPELAATTLASLGLPAKNTVLAGVDTSGALDWAHAQGIPYVTGLLARPGK